MAKTPIKITTPERICILAAIVYTILALLFVRGIPAQVIKPMDKAKVGEVVYRKGTTEITKATNNKLHAKVYAFPQWDNNGKALLTVDGNRMMVRGRYVRFLPDTATGKLQHTTVTGNSSVKEYWMVPDNKTKSLSWTIDTDAPVYEYSGGRVTYRDTQGAILFIVEPPYAWDAEKKTVKINTSFKNGTLVYDIQGNGYAYPLTIDPTLTLTASNDGTLDGTGASYAESRDLATATSISTTALAIGQNATSNTVERSFLSFALPSMHEVLAETLYVNGRADASTTDFEIYIHTATQSNPLVEGDYDLFDGRTAGAPHTGSILNAVWSSSSFSADWNMIVFNAAGRDTTVAHRDGTFRIAMISKEDYNNSAPGGTTEFLSFENSSTSGSEPYLSLLYVPPLALTRTIIYDKNPNMLWNNGDPIYIWKP